MDLVETYREELRFARKPLGRTLLILLLVALALLPWWGPRAWLSRASMIWLLAVGVLGQNLLIGYTGLISFGQAGFLAIGAYAFGDLRIAEVPSRSRWPPPERRRAWPDGWWGFPSLRLKGPYLAIATLGLRHGDLPDLRQRGVALRRARGPLDGRNRSPSIYGNGLAADSWAQSRMAQRSRPPPSLQPGH